jgi:hypothetical protein
MIRMLTEGVRRTELIQQQTNDLPVDVIAQPFVRVVPLKGARGSTEGRIVPLSAATARALPVPGAPSQPPNMSGVATTARNRPVIAGPEQAVLTRQATRRSDPNAPPWTGACA